MPGLDYGLPRSIRISCIARLMRTRCRAGTVKARRALAARLIRSAQRENTAVERWQVRTACLRAQFAFPASQDSCGRGAELGLSRPGVHSLHGSSAALSEKTQLLSVGRFGLRVYALNSHFLHRKTHADVEQSWDCQGQACTRCTAH